MTHVHSVYSNRLTDTPLPPSPPERHSWWPLWPWVHRWPGKSEEDQRGTELTTSQVGQRSSGYVYMLMHVNVCALLVGGYTCTCTCLCCCSFTDLTTLQVGGCDKQFVSSCTWHCIVFVITELTTLQVGGRRKGGGEGIYRNKHVSVHVHVEMSVLMCSGKLAQISLMR